MKRLKEILYRNLPTITLEELYGYINEIEGGYITARYHPEDSNLAILNYTELTVFERRWNKYTMSARGLILDLTDVKNNGKIYILAKPFDKFPNYGSNEIDGYEDDINFNDIESIMEKVDGSLGISYFFNDEIRFATRGSFTSEQAIKATEIWRENYAQNEEMTAYAVVPVTYLVEIIYPQNRVVVDYGDREELVMIGVNHLFDSPIDCDYNAIKDEAEHLGMPVAKQYNHLSIEDMLEMKKKISANDEGWIIKFKNGKRLKIKGDQYLNVHRAMYGLSDKAKVGTWADGNMEELIKTVPEEFRKEIEDLRDKLDERAEIEYRTLIEVYASIIELHKERKDFAIFVNKGVKKEYRKFMFIAYNNDGEISMDIIKEHIYKNYKHYLEVIGWKSNDS